jgi:predicted nucleic acid-binding protein
MITLDTSGFWAVTNVADPAHAAALAALEADFGPWYIPAGVLSEISWIIGARDRPGKTSLETLRDFLADLATGQYTLDCGQQDFPRIGELVTKYHDSGLDFGDASVVSCAERHGGSILTTDRRHFSIVARGEKGIIVLPEPT